MSITLPEEASLMTMVVTIRFRPAALPGDGADLPVNTWRVRLGVLADGTDALGAAISGRVIMSASGHYAKSTELMPSVCFGVDSGGLIAKP